MGKETTPLSLPKKTLRLVERVVLGPPYMLSLKKRLGLSVASLLVLGGSVMAVDAIARFSPLHTNRHQDIEQIAEATAPGWRAIKNPYEGNQSIVRAYERLVSGEYDNNIKWNVALIAPSQKVIDAQNFVVENKDLYTKGKVVFDATLNKDKATTSAEGVGGALALFEASLVTLFLVSQRDSKPKGKRNGEVQPQTA